MRRHAAFAIAQAYARQADPSVFYGGDVVAPLVVNRATVTPGSTATPGWAAELAQSSWGDFLLDLGQYGAVSRLLAQATRAAVGPVDATSYPVRSGAPVLPAWVDELDAIPVRAAAFSLVSVGPMRKLAHILAWSRELSRRSDAERIFSGMLRADVSAGLDAALLADTAGSAVAPATDEAAAKADLANLATAVGTNGSGSCTFIVSPGRLARLRVLAPTLVPTIDVVASAAVPIDRVVGVDGQALIVAIDDQPGILRSTEAAINMSDTPLPILDAGTVDPVTSLFQIAGIAIRVIHEIDFVMRRPGAVQFIDGVAW